MKLEDEIQQKNFKSPQHKLAINVIYTANWLSGVYSSFFKDKDITFQQYNVLRILRGQHPNFCNLKLIKERMLDRMSDASRIVDKLVAKDLVERHSCPADRRQIHLIISSKGLELLGSLDFIDEETKDLFSSVSNKDIENLNLLLDELRGTKD